MQRNKVFNMLHDKLVFEILRNKLKLEFNKSQTLTLSVRLLCTYVLTKERNFFVDSLKGVRKVWV